MKHKINFKSNTTNHVLHLWKTIEFITVPKHVAEIIATNNKIQTTRFYYTD